MQNALYVVLFFINFSYSPLLAMFSQQWIVMGFE